MNLDEVEDGRGRGEDAVVPRRAAGAEAGRALLVGPRRAPAGKQAGSRDREAPRSPTAYGRQSLRLNYPKFGYLDEVDDRRGGCRDREAGTVHPEGNLWANYWFLKSIPTQITSESECICGRLT